jgi:Zinc knuckle
MSNDYESAIVKFRGDLNDTMLAKLCREVVRQYKSLINTGGGKTGSESVLTATLKTLWKKFKGTCRNCGKIGHEAHECQSIKVESTDEATKNSGTSEGNKSHETCCNCQQKGHFANKCMLPKKLKSDANDSMGMFVGVTFTDSLHLTENLQTLNKKRILLWAIMLLRYRRWDNQRNGFSIWELPATLPTTRPI